MRKRLGRLFLFGLSGLFLLVLVALLLAPNIPFVRGWVVGFVERGVEQQILADLDIGRTEGIWPFRIVLADIKLNDEAGVLITADRAVLQWRPLMLALGRVRVDEILVGPVEIVRFPAIRPSDKPPAPRDAFPVFDLSIKDIQFNDIRLSEQLIDGGASVGVQARVQPKSGGEKLLAIDANATVSMGRLKQSDLVDWHGDDLEIALAGVLSKSQFTADHLQIKSVAGALTLRDLEVTPLFDLVSHIGMEITLPPTVPTEIVEQVGANAAMDGKFSVESGGGQVSFDFAIATDRLDNAVKGTLEIRNGEGGLGADADITVAGAFAGIVSPNITFDGDAPVRIEIRQDDVLSAKVLATVPPANTNSQELPAVDIVLDGDDLLGAAVLAIDLTAKNRRQVTVGTAQTRLETNDWRAFELPELAMRYEELTLSASGAAALSPLSVKAEFDFTAPDLTVLLPELPSAKQITANGSIETGAFGDKINITANSEEIAYKDFYARKLYLAVNGTTKNASVSAGATNFAAPGLEDGEDLQAIGSFAQAGDQTQINLSTFALTSSGTNLNLDRPVEAIVQSGSAVVEPFRLRWGDRGVVEASGQYGPKQIVANLTARDVDVPGLALRLSGDVGIDTRAAMKANLRADLISTRASDTALGLSLDGNWDGDRVRAKTRLAPTNARSGRSVTDFATIELPLRLIDDGSALSVALDDEIHADINYDGPAEPLFALAGLSDQTLEGSLGIDIDLGGSIDNLSADGLIKIEDGRYENYEAGLTLTELNATAKGAGGLGEFRFDLDLSAHDGQKTPREGAAIAGKGTIEKRSDQLNLNMDLSLNDALLVDRDDISGRFSGQTALVGTLPNLDLSGELKIDELNVLIPSTNPDGEYRIVETRVVRPDDASNSAGPPDPSTSALRVGLNLHIIADDRIFVRGRGIDTEWASNIKVLGEASDVQLDGQATLRRGGIDFAGRRLDFTKGEISFAPDDNLDPALALTAETEAKTGEQINLNISGRASSPKISLSSDPALPEDDVMALLLFGRPVTELTAVESVQLARSIASLSGSNPVGGRSILDRARQSLGLDVLQVGPANDGSTGVTLGKYVAEGVYVSVDQGAAQGSGSVSVEIELTDSVTLETGTGQDASSSASINWKRDY